MHALRIVFSIALLFSSTLFAQTLTPTLGEKKYDIYQLATSSNLTDGAASADLKAVSHGVRKKKAYGLITVSVYYAEFLAAKPEALIKADDQIVNSLKAAGPVQLRLTMLRDLTGKQISDSFKDALAANDIQEKNYSTELKSVFEEINSMKKFKEGETFSIASSWKDNQSTLFLQKPDNSIKKISGDAQFASQMFQIWFGKPVDDKLALLKKELLK